MSYIVPNSTLQLFKGINLDNRYMHSVYFADAHAQDYAFSSKVFKTYNEQSYRRYTANTVRVESPTGELLGVSYMRFKNKRSSDMWFYCFVNAVDYISETTCIIYYEIDVMQTWFIQKGKVQPCRILREHSIEDGILANFEPEPIGSDRYQYDFIDDCNRLPLGGGSYTTRAFKDYNLVINTSGEPTLNTDIGGLFSGTKYNYVQWNSASDTSSVIQALQELIGSWDVGNRREEVLNLFTFPKYFCENPYEGLKILDAEPKYKGYTPKNKKLLTYPYSYLYCTTLNGSAAQYRWEYFKHPYPNQINFTINGNVNGGGQIICYPNYYKGIDKDYDEAVTMDNFPKNAFNYDAYQAWVASGGKTKAEFEGKLVSARGALKMASDILNIRSAQVSTFTGTTNGVMQTGKVYANKGMSASTVQAAASTIGSAYNGRINEVQQAINTANDIIDIAEAKMKINYQFKDAQYQPNDTVGISESNITVGRRDLNFYFYNAHVVDDEMKRLDDFFSMYGYASNRVKAPNFVGRRYWNFIMTENCVVSGEMPATSKEALERIFDGGITMWHNLNNIGNYNLDVTQGTINNPINA